MGLLGCLYKWTSVKNLELCLAHIKHFTGIFKKKKKAFLIPRECLFPLSFSSGQSLSCVGLFCNPINCGMPGLPVHHQHPKRAQIHVHWVSDAIQPFHPLLPPSPPIFNPSQHQGLFQWVRFFTSHGQSIGASASASGLPMKIQDWFPLGLTGLSSLQSKAP